MYFICNKKAHTLLHLRANFSFARFPVAVDCFRGEPHSASIRVMFVFMKTARFIFAGRR